eukprot:4665822-Pleurochrysis_carterae.AAC.2
MVASLEAEARLAPSWLHCTVHTSSAWPSSTWSVLRRARDGLARREWGNGRNGGRAEAGYADGGSGGAHSLGTWSRARARSWRSDPPTRVWPTVHWLVCQSTACCSSVCSRRSGRSTDGGMCACSASSNSRRDSPDAPSQPVRARSSSAVAQSRQPLSSPTVAGACTLHVPCVPSFCSSAAPFDVSGAECNGASRSRRQTRAFSARPCSKSSRYRWRTTRNRTAERAGGGRQLSCSTISSTSSHSPRSTASRSAATRGSVSRTFDSSCMMRAEAESPSSTQH